MGCTQCMIGYFGNPYGLNGSECLDCDCNILGSDTIECDSKGICSCKENIIGVKCDLGNIHK